MEDFEIEESLIVPEARLKKDLGIDSLDVVDIVAFVEKNFGLKMKPEEIYQMATFAQFCDYIEKKVR